MIAGQVLGKVTCTLQFHLAVETDPNRMLAGLFMVEAAHATVEVSVAPFAALVRFDT